MYAGVYYGSVGYGQIPLFFVPILIQILSTTPEAMQNLGESVILLSDPLF